MTDELEPLSPKLRELLRKEREEAVPVPRAAEDRLLTMLRAASPLPSAPQLPEAGQVSAPQAASAWLAPKALIVASATGVLGFVGGLVVSPSLQPDAPVPQISAPEESRPEPSAEPSDAAALAPEAGTALIPDRQIPTPTTPPKTPKRTAKPAPEPTVEPAPAVVPSVPAEKLESSSASDSAAPDVQHASERQLIDAARVALGRGRSHDALVFLMGHERRFPEGSFVEERELLVIEALIAQGKSAPARARGQAFLAKFPRSTHAPRVRALLATP